MTLIWGRLRQWSQIISAHAVYFHFRISGTNHFIFVEFRTTFFWVSTCFNGCAAATDARLGTRLRWFCDRGVWWKRTFCGKFGSWNDVDSLLLLDWDARCQQWFEWRWQRFCCDVPDSNDSLTSRRRLIYVNLCFHFVSSISLKNRMPVIPFASERVFNSATFMPMLIPLKTLRNVSNLHLKIYSG